MRINKEFAPITILLETAEDKYMFINILEAAYRKRTENSFFRPNITQDAGVQEIRNLMDKLS